MLADVLGQWRVDDLLIRRVVDWTWTLHLEAERVRRRDQLPVVSRLPTHLAGNPWPLDELSEHGTEWLWAHVRAPAEWVLHLIYREQ